MYHVYKTKGEYEPWWFFEGWEELITLREAYAEFQEAEVRFRELAEELSRKYPHQKTKKKYLTAFWDEQEVHFCESCDDDIQVYHGVMLLQEGHVLLAEG